MIAFVDPESAAAVLVGEGHAPLAQLLLAFAKAGEAHRCPQRDQIAARPSRRRTRVVAKWQHVEASNPG